MGEFRVVEDIGALTWAEHLGVNELISFTLENSTNVSYTTEQLKIMCSSTMSKSIKTRLKVKSYGVLYKQDGKILGCGFGVVADEVIEGKALYVHPSLQNQGIGSLILSKLERRAKELDAKRICLHTDFPEFYLNRGYSITDERIEKVKGVKFELKMMCKEL